MAVLGYLDLISPVQAGAQLMSSAQQQALMRQNAMMQAQQMLANIAAQRALDEYRKKQAQLAEAQLKMEQDREKRLAEDWLRKNEAQRQFGEWLQTQLAGPVGEEPGVVPQPQLTPQMLLEGIARSGYWEALPSAMGLAQTAEVTRRHQEDLDTRKQIEEMKNATRLQISANAYNAKQQANQLAKEALSLKKEAMDNLAKYRDRRLQGEEAQNALATLTARLSALDKQRAAITSTLAQISSLSSSFAMPSDEDTRKAVETTIQQSLRDLDSVVAEMAATQDLIQKMQSQPVGTQGPPPATERRQIQVGDYVGEIVE